MLVYAVRWCRASAQGAIVCLLVGAEFSTTEKSAFCFNQFGSVIRQSRSKNADVTGLAHNCIRDASPSDPSTSHLQQPCSAPTTSSRTRMSGNQPPSSSQPSPSSNPWRSATLQRGLTPRGAPTPGSAPTPADSGMRARTPTRSTTQRDMHTHTVSTLAPRNLQTALTPASTAKLMSRTIVHGESSRERCE